MPSYLQRQSKTVSPVGLGSGAATNSIMDRETKSRIFESAKAEFVRHKWDMFEEEPPTASAEDRGASIPGCPACRKRINTLDQFFRHQSDDVLPVILRKAFEIAGVPTAE